MKTRSKHSAVRSPDEILTDVRRVRVELAQAIADLFEACRTLDEDEAEAIHQPRIDKCNLEFDRLALEAWQRPNKTVDDLPLLAEIALEDVPRDLDGGLTGLDSSARNDRGTAQLLYWMAQIFSIPVTFSSLPKASRVRGIRRMRRQAVTDYGRVMGRAQA